MGTIIQKISTKKTLNIVAVIVIVLGFLTWIPNLIFHTTSGYWLLTIPFGLIGLTISVIEKRKILIILSILLTTSFFILMSVGSILESLSIIGNKPYDESYINAPDFSIAISMSGDIYNIIDASDDEPKYIYFGRTDCLYCSKFSETLAQTIGAQTPMIYYYNTKVMPRKEAEDVLERFSVESVPLLVKIDHGFVVNQISIADTTKINIFFNKQEE